MDRLERDVQEKIIKKIEKYNGYVYKNAQSIYTEKGRPDLTACIPTTTSKLVQIFGENYPIGIYVGIEVKLDCEGSYQTTEAQKIVGRKIQKAKGIFLAVDDPLVIEALMLKFKDENIKEKV